MQNHRVLRHISIFFDPPKKRKPPVQKALSIKIDLHPPGTSKRSKNLFLLQQDWFLEGFGVLGGCKSILNANVLHKFYIACGTFWTEGFSFFGG